MAAWAAAKRAMFGKHVNAGRGLWYGAGWYVRDLGGRREYFTVGRLPGFTTINKIYQNTAVTGIARTVVDCFKFRNKIGLDVALESLSEVRRNHRATIDDIWKTAAPLRMTNVMRPYLESLA